MESAAQAGNMSVFGKTNITDLDPSTPLKSLNFHIIMEVFVVGIICLFGFVGNVLCSIVLLRDKPTPTVSLLMALSMADLCVLVYIFVSTTVYSICRYYEHCACITAISLDWQAYLWAAGNTAQMVMIWLIVLVSVDRYVAICRPLLHTSWWNIAKARRAVAATVLFCALFNVPRILYYQVPSSTGEDANFESSQPNTTGPQCSGNTCWEIPNSVAGVIVSQRLPSMRTGQTSSPVNLTNSQNGDRVPMEVTGNQSSQSKEETIYCLDRHNKQLSTNSAGQQVHDQGSLSATSQCQTPSSNISRNLCIEHAKNRFYKHQERLQGKYWFGIIYTISLSWIFVYILPICLLLYLNARLLNALRLSRRNHAVLTRTNAQREKLSVTVNISAVITVFLICQIPDLILCIILLPNSGVDKNIMVDAVSITWVFQAVNSAVNFIIYCLFYKRFRRLVVAMFCKEAGLTQIQLRQASVSQSHHDTLLHSHSHTNGRGQFSTL